MKVSKKQQILNFIEKNKHGLLLLYFLIYLPWFQYVEKTVTTHFHVIHVALDDYIPFCEYFIVPYLLWFGYVAWGISYFFLKNKSEYYKLCAFLFTGMTIFLIISTVYPNGHYLNTTIFLHRQSDGFIPPTPRQTCSRVFTFTTRSESTLRYGTVRTLRITKKSVTVLPSYV